MSIETMPYRYLARLARQRLPVFVARPSKVRVLRRLAQAGHIDARFYPPDPSAGQFGEVRGLTPAGWKAVQGGDDMPAPEEHSQ
ncbi:hypothetical protein [Variovorax paradoxus]|uniref:hypothetical protein n=1 Tax=Variovorax paradoxus TaxID=34073 RepID=UPI0029C97898|nr:hypothetical protein RZE77_10575 [Variovorax paradoxus]